MASQAPSVAGPPVAASQPSPGSNANGAQQAGPHLLSLKVMRASAPALAVSEKPYYDDADLPPGDGLLAAVGRGIDAGLSQDLLANAWDRGASSSSAGGAAYRAASESFAISGLLVLPNSFGTLFLGETFRSYLCVRNESGAAVREPSLRVEMQVGASDAQQPSDSGRWHQLAHIILPSPSRYSPEPSSRPAPGPDGDDDDDDDGSGGGDGHPVWELAPAQALETSLGYDIKDLGPHVLVCTVGYKAPLTLPDGTVSWVERSFRKFFKFAVERSPISVRTKVHQPRAACAQLHPDAGVRERVELEVQLQNVAANGASLVLERLDLKPAPGWRWQSIDRPWLTSEAVGAEKEADADMWTAGAARSNLLLADGDVRQYLFVLQRADEVAWYEARQQGAEMGVTPEGWMVRGDALGHLDIGWRMSLGEPGRLQTSQLVRRRVVAPAVSPATAPGEGLPGPQLVTQLQLRPSAIDALAHVAADTATLSLDVAVSIADLSSLSPGEPSRGGEREDQVREDEDDDTPLSEIASPQRGRVRPGARAGEGGDEVRSVVRTFELALQHCSVEASEARGPEEATLDSGVVTPRRGGRSSRTSTPVAGAAQLMQRTRLQTNLSNLVRAGSLSLRPGRSSLDAETSSGTSGPTRQSTPAPPMQEEAPVVPPKASAGAGMPVPVLSSARMDKIHAAWMQNHAQAVSRSLQPDHLDPSHCARFLGTSIVALPPVTLRLEARRHAGRWQTMSPSAQTVETSLTYALDAPPGSHLRLGAVRILLLSYRDDDVQRSISPTVLDEIPVIAECLIP